MSMETRRDAEQHITDIIESGDATAADFDIDAIVDDAYDAAGGTWDIEHLDSATFWDIVGRHDNAGPVDADAPESASTDIIATELLKAQVRVNAAQAEVLAASEARDALVVQLRKTGTPAAQIADMLDVTRARIYAILDRAGLS